MSNETKYEIHCIMTRRDGRQIGDWEIVPTQSGYTGYASPADIERDDNRLTSKEMAIELAEAVWIREDPSIMDAVYDEFPDDYHRLVENPDTELLAQSIEAAKAKAIEDGHSADALDAWKERKDRMEETYLTSDIRATRLMTRPDGGFEAGVQDKASYSFRKDDNRTLRVEVVEAKTGTVIASYGPPAPKGGDVQKWKLAAPMGFGYGDCPHVLTLEDVGRIPEWLEEGRKPARSEHYSIGK